MNKFLRLSFFILLSLFITTSLSVAEEIDFSEIDSTSLPPPQGNPPGFEQQDSVQNKSFPSISVSEIKLEKDTYNAGDTVKGTVILKNGDSFDASGVFLDISLAGKYSKEEGRFNIPDIIYDTKSIGPVFIKAGGVNNVPFSYKMPEAVGGLGLGIHIDARLESGILLGWSDVFLAEVKGGKSLLRVTAAYINVDGKKYAAQTGPTIGATTTVNFHLEVTNPSSESITVTPAVEVHERSSSGKLIKEYKEKSVTISPNGSHEFVFEPDRNNDIPGVYVADVTLLDSANISRAPTMQYRYIMPGEAAIIHNVHFADKSVFKNDIVNVDVSYSGSPYDIRTGEKADLSEATLKISIFDGSSDILIGEETKDANFNGDVENASVPVSITKDASTIKVLSSIERNGKVLATYATPVTTPDLEKMKGIKNRGGLLWPVVGVSVLLLILILYFLRKKKGVVALSLFISLSMVGGSFVAKAIVNKSVDYDLHYSENYNIPYDPIVVPQGTAGATCKTYPANAFTGHNAPYTVCTVPPKKEPTGPWETVTLTKPLKPWVVPGEAVPVQGSVVSSFCTNVPENLTLTVWADSSTNVEVPGSRRTSQYSYAVNPTKFNRATFSYGNLITNNNLTIPAGKTSATYYIYVNSVTSYQGDADHRYNHYGINTQRIPIYVFPKVSVTCAPDKTTAVVGDPVKWTMTISGGSNAYNTHWTDLSATDVVDPLLNYRYNVTTQKSVKEHTITYTTPGIKKMYTAAKDYFTENYSMDNNRKERKTVDGVYWDKCGSGVNVVLASTKPVLSASPTPSCGGKVELLWTASTGATGYEVYRKNADNTFTKLGDTLASTVSDFTDTVAPGSSQTYKVKALNSTGGVESDPITTTASENCICTNGAPVYPSCVCPTGQTEDINGICKTPPTPPPGGVTPPGGGTPTGGTKGAESINPKFACFTNATSETKYNNIITWDAPAGISESSYEVLRGGISINTSGNTNFTDTYSGIGFAKGESITYKIKTTNSTGISTSPDMVVLVPNKDCPTLPGKPSILNFDATPPFINPPPPPGGICTLSWNLNAASGECRIVGNGDTKIFKPVDTSGISKVYNVKKDTQYFMTCKSLSDLLYNPVDTRSATCKINPDYRDN